MKSGEIIGAAAVVIILLGIAMALAGPGTMIGKAWTDTLASRSQSIPAPAPDTGSSVVGSPTISAQQIDAILCKYQSPACGTGQTLYDDGLNAHIDPAFALGVFLEESDFGRNGEAADSHSLGNLRCIPDAACVNGYAWFNSWQDGYAAFYKLISGPYYVGSGLTTPETILPKYAPSDDNNDPQHYASVVESAMSLWRSGSTGVPA
jgi:hypothetical protein